MRGSQIAMAAALLASSVLAPAAAEVKAIRVGMLCVSGESTREQEAKIFVGELARMGWIEGKNLTLDRPELPSLEPAAMMRATAEMVARRANVITTWCGSGGALAAQQTTRTTPIVFNGSADPVAIGLVASLARPGRNLTGFSSRNSDLAAKNLETLAKVRPNIARVAVIYHVDAEHQSWFSSYRQSLERAGRVLSVSLHFTAVPSTEALERTFVQLKSDGTDAAMLLGHTSEPVDFFRHASNMALKHRLPSSGGINAAEPPGSGTLLGSVGPDGLHGRGMARLVAKIINGTPPRDIPVEQTEPPGLAVDLRIARLLGLTIPPSLLMQATEVIR